MSLHQPAQPDAAAFERCMAVGGVAVFPADTVYGLACDAQSRVAVERLYRLKRRPLDKPSAVMFFSLELAITALPELGEHTQAALRRLMPGPVSVLLPNPELRYPLACGADKLTLGLRVPDVPAFGNVRWPILQSSANFAGGPDACRLSDVPDELRRSADMVIDGGALPGTPSTVIDLRRYEQEGRWQLIRHGGMSEGAVAGALDGEFHFDPESYATMIRADIPAYDELQDRLVSATRGMAVSRVLDLGTGTGETAARLLAAHPQARLTGLDTNPAMLAAARERLPAARVDLRAGRLEDALPPGPFELVTSALAVHHLDADGKRDLFTRIAAVLAPGGVFLLGDVIAPVERTDATIPLTEGYDLPSTVDEQLGWLRDAGLEAAVDWVHGDLAVLSGTRPA